MKRLILLFAPLAMFAAAPVSDWAPNLTSTVAWHGNASNGAAVWDRIGALRVGADLVASSHYEISSRDAAHATLHFGGDWFPRFSRLNRGALGGRLDWQHTFGSDSRAPVFTVEATGDALFAVERERRGTLTGLSLNLSKRFFDAWRLGVTQRFDEYSARGAVFDGRSYETAAEIGYDLNAETRMTVSARWREGDVVTYAYYQRPDLMAIAHTTARLRTFGSPITAYATEAQTLGGRISLVHATGEDTAMVLAYDVSKTTRTGLKFANQVVSLSFVRQY